MANNLGNKIRTICLALFANYPGIDQKRPGEMLDIFNEEVGKLIENNRTLMTQADIVVEQNNFLMSENEDLLQMNASLEYENFALRKKAKQAVIDNNAAVHSYRKCKSTMEELKAQVESLKNQML